MSKTLTFYGYDKCDTCRKAKKALLATTATLKDIDITTTPPTKTLLKSALGAGYKITDLFNKSGVSYREGNWKEKVKTLTEAKLIEALASEGRLVKRPIVSDGKTVTVGFDTSLFAKTWGTK